MRTTAAIKLRGPLSGLSPAQGQSAQREAASQARERDQLIDRLHRLRQVLPVLAREMASARRQAAHLKLDNRRLTEQVRELRAALEARERGMR